MEIFSVKLGMDLRVINVYGPCQDRVSFWNDFFSKELLKNKNLIIGGDLNFSLGFSESWGYMAQVDSITGYMTNLME